MASGYQRVGQVADQPLAAAPLLWPEDMTDERDPDGARIILGSVRKALSGLLSLWRRLQLAVWATRARTRMRWVGIRLEVSLGEGVVFVRNPFVLAGVGPPEQPGSLRIVLGNRVRCAPGVIIEAEPGTDSVLEIGDGTRIGATTHFHLRGGRIRIGAGSEIRDGAVLKVTGGAELELGERVYMSYGCLLAATERIVLEERVGLGERVSVIDSDHETDGSGIHWTAQDLGTEPILIAENALVFANAVVTKGSHIGANSQVGAGALVRGKHPDGVLIAGVPAEVVKSLADDELG